MKKSLTIEQILIQDQRSLKGKVGRRGSMSLNGCGIVALFNAEQILGNKEATWRLVQEEMNRHPLMNTVLGGTLGITPWGIRRYFRRRGYFTRWCSTRRVSNQADAYIVWYIWKSPTGKNRFGAHYQAAFWGEDGQLVLSNFHSKHMDFNAFRHSDKNMLFVRILEIYSK